MKPIVKIGCSAVLSEEDDEAVHGQHIAQAVALAVEQANQGETCSFAVEMILGDDKAQPEAALAVARQFIEDPQVLGVVGTMNSHTSLATAPLYSQAKLTQISPAASNPTLTQQGFSSFFRVVPHDAYQGREGATYAVRVLGARRIAVVHDGGSFGRPLAEIFSRTSQELGAQIVQSCRIQPGLVDYSEAVAKVIGADPELVFFGVIEAEGRLLAAQLRQAGLRAPFLGTDGLKPSRFLATPDYNVDGPYHTSASTDVYSEPSAAAFARAYRERYGELYSIYTAEAYDAANILITACARSKQLDRPSVLAEVVRLQDFAGASGPITFDEFGERLNPQIGMYKVSAETLEFLGYTQDRANGVWIMKPLSQTAVRMPGSGIREIVHLAITMPDVIRLEVGEPNFPTPQHIIDAGYRAANEGFTKYGPSAGMLSLREMLAERIQRVNGFSVRPTQLNISVGGVQGCLASFLAMLDPGDEVLIPDPAWPNYEMALMLCQAVPVHYPLYADRGFVPGPEDLAGLVTERTKLLIINSPCNPTGAVFPRETIEALVAFAQQHDLYILADEVYDEFVFDGEHVSPALYDPDRIISIYSFSKIYAMTGWRVGYVVANEEISKLIAKIQEPQISCVSSVGQKAAEAALTGPQDCVAEMCQSYHERRDVVVQVLKDEGYYVYTPQGAFYIMVDISEAGLDSRQFALRLLQEGRVAIAPGTAFGNSGRDFVRISLATEKGQLLEGVRTLCGYIRELAGRR